MTIPRFAIVGIVNGIALNLAGLHVSETPMRFFIVCAMVNVVALWNGRESR